MEIRITATVPAPADAMEQAALLAAMKPQIEALREAVVPAGGSLDVRVVRPTGPRPKKGAEAK